MSKLLNTTEAALLLGISKSTLEHWRTVNMGPVFRRIGPRCVRYKQSDLDNYVEAQSDAPVDMGDRSQ